MQTIININLNLSSLDDLERAMDYIASRAPAAAVRIPIKGTAATGKHRAADLAEVQQFCTAENIPDAQWFWEKCCGNGWTNDGKPIKDWRATLRSWKAAGYLPSQKKSGQPTLGLLPSDRMQRLASLRDELRYAVGDEARTEKIKQQIRDLGGVA